MERRVIHIRDVPEALHRRLEEQAASLGLALSDYLLAELRRIAERPTREQMLARLKSREPVSDVPVADWIAEDRRSR